MDFEIFSILIRYAFYVNIEKCIQQQSCFAHTRWYTQIVIFLFLQMQPIAFYSFSLLLYFISNLFQQTSVLYRERSRRLLNIIYAFVVTSIWFSIKLKCLDCITRNSCCFYRTIVDTHVHDRWKDMKQMID